MKKVFWWIAAILLTPVVLFLTLAILLYLPPVQNWAVDKVTEMVSEDTGMDISIDRVCLVFPLDLGVKGIKVVSPKPNTKTDAQPNTKTDAKTNAKTNAYAKPDTIADIRNVVANIKLMPLFDGTLVIKKMEVAEARFNTVDMVKAAKVKGSLRLLSLRSDGISLSDSKALLNGARIDRAEIDVALADSVPEDTTTSENIWTINADKITLTHSAITIHTPGDTMAIKAGIGSLIVNAADINLSTQQYQVGSIEWLKGSIHFDNNMEEPVDGLDPNHIALTDIHLAADSILYSEALTHAVIRKMSMKEKSGLKLDQLYASLTMDSTDVDMPKLLIRTPYSEIMGKAKVSIKVADETQPGPFDIQLFGSIGKGDVMAFCGSMPKAFINRYPNHPISLRADINGNINNITIDKLNINLPTALRMNADGWVKDAMNADKLKAHINLDARTYNLGFITCMLPADIMANYRIPQGITAKGNIDVNSNRYSANLLIAEGKGRIKAKGEVDTKSERYKANIDINGINIRHFMPHDSIGIINAQLNAHGRGFDIMSKSATANANASVTRLDLGSNNLNNFTAKANVANGKGEVNISGNNHLLDGTIDLYALIDKKNIDATVAADIMRLDLHQMRITDKPMTIAVCMHADVASDLNQSHKADAIINDLSIITEEKTYRPADITLRLMTNPDTTMADMKSGNLILKLNAKGGYESLMSCGEKITNEMNKQLSQRVINNDRIKEILPDMDLYVMSGNDNPIANFMRMNGIEFKSIHIDLKSSPTEGLNGNGQLYSLIVDSTRIDTIRFDIYQDSLATRINGQVCNNKRNPQFVFNALFDAYVYDNNAGASIKYYDQDNKLGLDLGAKAEMADSGINIHIEPYKPILGYKAFKVNKDNYVFMAQSGRISANLDMIADDGAGVKLYSDDSDPELMQDMTVSLNRFDLGKITSVMPYMPSIEGLLGGDYHIVQTPNGKFSVMSDMEVKALAYEKSLIGNISSEFVYMQRDDDAHYVEARINKDNNEIGVLSGSYQTEGDGYLDAKFTMTKFPLDVINGFIPDQIMGLEGMGDGQLAVKGPLSRPVIDGEIDLNNSYLVSIPYGVRLRFDDDPVRIVGSRLLFENFTIYAKNDNPLIMYGNLDFSNLDAMRLDLKMKADNYQIIEAKYNPRSIAYGKAFVNFYGQISGLMSNLVMRGKLDVLGTTDMTYILRDSPLNTDDQLKGLVEFTNFSDSLSEAGVRPPVSGLDMLLLMNIEQGARIRCDLNADRSNYVEVEGGGDLRMTYNTLDNMQLFGRYTINEGEMKYELPVIPLKTFNIAKGSYVEFNGDMMNPRLNIEATEEVKALVAAETGSSRSVLFNCGVKVSKTLNDMGLEFTLDAPKDMSVKNELAAMSLEQRGKVAVTMLSTGMYLTDGNTSSFSMNSALNAFLQSEINNITSNAMKTVDISLGVDNTSDAAGNAHTDYSFRFAKRFWNNRFNFIIGGKLTDNSNSASTSQDNTFIDNVSLEYRLDQTAMRYVRIFYNKEADDLLEDKISEYGAGYVWRKKMDSLKDIFRNKKQTVFRKEDEKPQGDRKENEKQ